MAYLHAHAQISIHALREEGDHAIEVFPIAPFLFLSTPSARRATEYHVLRSLTYGFLSTPSARRATASAPRMAEEMEFLSTPSARRATCYLW